MPLFHLQERHKEGIRCESGTVPATVNPLVKTENLSTFATVAPFGQTGRRFSRGKSGNLPILEVKQ